ncbi:hypothetical protein [Streptomyces hebeiensis]
MPANTTRGYPYPVYGDTQNFPAQIQSLAQAINSDMQVLADAELATLNQPTVRLTSTTAQTATVGAYTTVSWAPGPPNYSNAGMWNSASPTIIQFTQPGVYLVSARLDLPASGTATEVGTYTLFGTTGLYGPNPARQTLRMQQTSPTRPDLTCIYLVPTAGETLSVFFRHDKATTFNIGARNLQATRISTAIGLP